MKILFLFSPSKLSDIPWTLMEMGHTVEYINMFFEYTISNEEQENILCEKLLNNRYDFVITYDYVPTISNVCEYCGVRYASWTYDTPLMSLYTDSIFNSCNYFFLFDKKQAIHLKKFGLEHVYHLPLGVNHSRIDVIKKKPDDRKRFSNKVAFVGSLYEKNQYNRICQFLREDIKSQFDSIFYEYTGKWNKNSIYDLITEEMTDYFNNTFFKDKQNNYNISDSLFYAMTFLPKKLGELDRSMILNRLSKYELGLYTDSTETSIKGVLNKGTVNYNEEMYKVFRMSDININISLRSIETGIPLRAFDVMGAGGFLISNYQEELEEYFIPDQELVLYKSVDELEDKVKYYLEHEEQRKKIAENGHKKVIENHTYIHRMQAVTRIMGE